MARRRRKKKKNKKGRFKRKANFDNASWFSFSRCFLFTLGIIFLGLPIWFFTKPWETTPPFWLYVLMLFLLALGLIPSGVALLGSKKVVEKCMDRCVAVLLINEVTIFVMILAAPFYFIMKSIKRK